VFVVLDGIVMGAAVDLSERQTIELRANKKVKAIAHRAGLYRRLWLGCGQVSMSHERESRISHKGSAYVTAYVSLARVQCTIYGTPRKCCIEQLTGSSCDISYIELNMMLL
jgi:hypothetical protein